MNYRMRLPIFTLSAIVFFVAAPSLFAQSQQSQQSQQQQQSQSQQQTNPPAQNQKPSLQNPQQNPPVPPPVDAKEEAAYKSFYDMKPSTAAENDAAIQAGETFLKDYPQSRYRESVYTRLTMLYFQKRDMDKMYENADKALALDPNNVDVLVQVGWVIPRGNPSTPDYQQMLTKAEQYEKHALEILSTLTKPVGLTDDQFNRAKADKSSQAHSGLGLVYFRENKFDESSVELTKATDGVPDPDPTDYYVLGIDLNNLQKYPESAKAFDSCAQIASSIQGTCKQQSAAAKAKEGAAPAHKP